MKKIFLFFCMVLTTLLVDAQSLKRVAILEVVDKEEMLSYSQKVLLRNTMARAIANREGYEAYDRTEVDAIMSEHEFQRTGVVSDSEIRKLGEMTGVSLILVSEGVLVGNDKIFISAKIINIETGKVEMMDNITTGLNNDEIRNGCETLIKRMIGVSESLLAKEKEQRMLSNKRAIIASSFIPGMGQMLKGQYGTGAAFLASEVALFAGGMTCCLLGKEQIKIMQSMETSYTDYQIAKKKKNTLDIVAGTCFGIGIAVHVANMVHAWYVKDKKLTNNIAFTPTIIQTDEYSTPSYAMGVGIQIKL